jgi:peptidoglycan L-alanyl-D-glutamate endopeptidase CwlK
MSRKIEDLCPVVGAMCRTFIATCKQKGIDLIVTSTLRTDKEQLAYYAQGRRSLSAVNCMRKQAGMPPLSLKENQRVVTANLTSIHQFGCAFDATVAKTGAVVYDIKADVNKDNIPDYEEIGAIGEAIGFRWGGKFPKRDYVHFEYTQGLKIPDLQAGKRPHEKVANA